MASLDMNGSYDLNSEVINDLIKEGEYGNYAYGDINPKTGGFIVKYVGRSDGDLRNRIKHGIGKYSKFKFSIAKNAKEAFEKECKNYYDFEPEDNNIHPDRPKGTNYKCPCCDTFD